MFGWFWRLIGKDTARRQPDAVFRFWDGTRVRVADPMETWHRLDRESGGKWQDWLRVLAFRMPALPPGPGSDKVREHHEKGQREAAGQVSAAVCAAFGVAPLDDSAGAGRATGLLLSERIALASAYLDHMGRLAELAKVPTTGSRSGTGPSPRTSRGPSSPASGSSASPPPGSGPPTSPPQSPAPSAGSEA